jgi:hypothetical protein
MKLSIFLLLSLILDHLTLASSWQQLGSTITSGEAFFSSFASAVNLSKDGQHVAVGSPHHDDGNGAVFLYKLDDKTSNLWSLLTSLPGASGEGLGDFFSLSPDGHMLTVCHHLGTPNMNVVQVYSVDLNIADQIGPNIVETCELEGKSVTLGQAASKYYLLVGCEFYNDNRGKVQALELEDKNSGSSEWKRYLSALEGSSQGGCFGSATAFAEAPSPFPGCVLCIAVASPNYNENQGLVQVFTANDAAGWSQLEDDLAGDTADEAFGTSIAMSKVDQPYLVFGSPHRVFRGEAQSCGAFQLFHWRILAIGAPLAWHRVGDILEGSAKNDHFGTLVAISRDGGRSRIGRGVGCRLESAST